MAVAPERALGGDVAHLPVAPGGVGRAEVRAVDDFGTPVPPAVVAPPVLGDEGVEVLAEGGERRALGDGLIHGGAQIAEQIVAHRPGHHEGHVVLVFPEVGPGPGRQIQFAAEERDLLGEGEPGVGEGGGGERDAGAGVGGERAGGLAGLLGHVEAPGEGGGSGGVGEHSGHVAHVEGAAGGLDARAGLVERAGVLQVTADVRRPGVDERAQRGAGARGQGREGIGLVDRAGECAGEVVAAGVTRPRRRRGGGVRRAGVGAGRGGGRGREDLVILVRRGEPEPGADLVGTHAQAERDQAFERLGHEVYVDCALALDLDHRILLPRAVVERDDGDDEVATERRRELAPVRVLDVLADQVVHLPEGVAAAAALLRGQGLAEHRDGYLLVQVGEQVGVDVGAFGGGHVAHELDGHALGQDGGGVGADLGDGAVEGAPVAGAGGCVVLPEPDGLAVDLGEAHPVLEGCTCRTSRPRRRCGRGRRGWGGRTWRARGGR